MPSTSSVLRPRRHARVQRRLLPLMALCLGSAQALAAAPSARSDPTQYRMSIPQQQLHAALKDLARITGLQIARFGDVSADAGRTNAVRGEYTATQALDKLLQGTGLTYRFVNERMVAIVRGRKAPASHQAVAKLPAAPSPAVQRASATGKDGGALARLRKFLGACGPITTPHQECTHGASTNRSQSALDEVIVTARKRQEGLQSVPVAVTALTGAALNERAAHTLEDLRFHAPAFQISPSPFGPMVPGISIRGQRQLEAIITLDPAVGVYFADVVWERPHGTNASLYDLQSVQVLKGPQGTLFGRNTTGGAVLISPNKPSFAGLDGYLETTFGNYDSRDFAAMLNVPITDSVAVRFATQLNRHDGYTNNRFDGSRKDDANDESYRLALTFRPNENVDSTTVYQYFRTDARGSGWRLAAVNPDSALANVDAGGGPAVIAAMQSTLTELQSRDWHTLINDQRAGTRITTQHASNTTSWTLGDLTFKNIIGWRQIDSFAALDFDGSAVVSARTAAQANGLPQAPITIFNSKNAAHVHQWTEELQVFGTALDEQLDWIGGLYYFLEKGSDVQHSDLFGRRVNDGVGENESKSLFLQGTYRLAGLQGWSLTAGARHTWDDRTLEQHQQAMFPGDAHYRCRLVDPPVPLETCARHRTYQDSAPTWGVTLDYNFGDDTMVYIARRRGYKSGGLQLRANAPSEPATFEPEFVDDWEVGVKSTFELAGMRTRLNVAVYDQDYDNIQRTVSIQTSGSTQLVTTVLNAARARIKGGEVELTVQPLRRLELSGALAVTDASYDSFKQPSTRGGIADLAAGEFAMIPKRVHSATARFELPSSTDIGALSIGGHWYGQSRMEITDVNVADGVRNGEGRIPGYHLIDAYLDWSQVMRLPLDLRWYVRNLTDKDYATGGISVFSTSGFYSYTLGAPRTYGMQIRYRFGAQK